MKKLILAGLFAASLTAMLQAQESFDNEASAMRFFPRYGAAPMWNVSPMAYPASGGGKFGMSVLNIFFGLGSWISGDWQNGLGILLLQGGGIAVTIWGGSEVAKSNWGPLALFHPGVWLAVGGVCLWGYGTIIGFGAPFGNGLSSPAKRRTAQLNDPRNWAAAFAPAPGGGVTGALAFTAHL